MLHPSTAVWGMYSLEDFLSPLMTTVVGNTVETVSARVTEPPGQIRS